MLLGPGGLGFRVALATPGRQITCLRARQIFLAMLLANSVFSSDY